LTVTYSGERRDKLWYVGLEVDQVVEST